MPGLQPQEVAHPRAEIGVDPLLRREGTCRNGWQPTADALLTMYFPTQLAAGGGNGIRLFLRFREPADLPLVATGCDPGAP
jgi:hypothetical protein